MSCRWVWNDDYQLWQTDCGSDLTEDDRHYLDWELGMKRCLWCGKPVEEVDETSGSCQREEESALRRDYYRAVMPR